MAVNLYQEGLPALTLWETLTERAIELNCKEDNEATIKVIRKGYSPKLRHLTRTHKVDIASFAERFQEDSINLEYVKTDAQVADIFTKALEPNKWDHAIKLLHMETKALPDVMLPKVTK